MYYVIPIDVLPRTSILLLKMCGLVKKHSEKQDIVF